MSGTIKIGISGWTYDGWRGAFYPKDLPYHRELEHASRQVSSIEINGTFYGLQSPKSYAAWHDKVPDDFAFSVKAPGFITHVKRLKNVETPLANFFANGVFRLEKKLGPILWQLPPSLKFDAGLLEAFLGLLPHDTNAAARLARRHDSIVDERCDASPGENRPLRHALEVRHASYRDPRFFSILRRAGVALVTADTAGKWPYFEELTADFAYARLHGDEEIYVSGYTSKALRAWAAKIRAWIRGGKDAYVYFDNDRKVRAPFDAMSLMRLLRCGGAPLVAAKTACTPVRAEHLTFGVNFSSSAPLRRPSAKTCTEEGR
jgi:uncharacterized protein YecE (DUF72 family)